MSGALPTTPAPASATLGSVQPTRVSQAHSLKRQARTRGAQRWTLHFAWAPLKRAEFAALHAFLLSQRGQADSFTTLLPGHTAPQGSWAGAPVVNGAGQSGRSVSLRGFTASQAGVAKAGDLLKFAGHSKVYMVTADAASNGSGIAAVSIEPALISGPADGEAITSSNVPFTVALAGDNLDVALSPGVLYDLEVDLVEVW
jgi:hypothetical protein